MAHRQLRWFGEIPAYKWMQLYTKVLALFVGGADIRFEVKVSVAPEGGVEMPPFFGHWVC
jgi:hypothetical protein